MLAGAGMKSLAATALALAGLAQAQTPPASALSTPAPALQQACSAVPQQPFDGRGLALRSQCVLMGLVASAHPVAEARELARKSLALGEPAGGFMLYLVFNNDPENTYLRAGKPDLDLYRKLGRRGLAQRAEQVEAIDGLAFAAGKGHANAGILLARLFHETVAPRNVARLSALVDLLNKRGEHSPELERFGRQAEAVGRAAPATKASVRAFFDAYRTGVATAIAGYGVQTGGKSCGEASLKSATAGDIAGAEYLPLKSVLAEGSFLVRGEWPEFWTFTACGEDVPVKITFVADGWGRATFTAIHNKGA